MTCRFSDSAQKGALAAAKRAIMNGERPHGAAQREMLCDQIDEVVARIERAPVAAERRAKEREDLALALRQIERLVRVCPWDDVHWEAVAFLEVMSRK